MTKKEWLQICREKQKIFSGILFHHQIFAKDKTAVIRYELDCPQYALLREKYDLEQLAGKGTDFSRAKRLMHALAPRLTHSSWYDNHVPCNALDLLEYSLDHPQQGINCLNKAKILAECCLALGIYARRVSILPYSPYDFDNHVVTEIYDRKLKKWIMLDLTTDGYFVDEEKHPLSLLEIRHRFAEDAFVTFVKSTDRLRDLKQSAEKNAYFNSYICKNLFYFTTGCRNGFGPSEDWLVFAPEHFRVQEKNVANAVFRCKNMPEVSQQLRAAMEARLEQQRAAAEPEKTDISVLLVSPDGGK